jgi:hypothetical protein
MTDPNPTVRMPLPEEPSAPAPAPAAPADAGLPPPARPSSGWVAPPPAARRPERHDGRTGSIVFGAILLAVGIWFFLERTLGLELPDIRWSQFWPVILIVIGGWLVLGSWRSRRP